MCRLFVHFQVTRNYIHDFLNHAFSFYRQAVVNPDIAARKKVKKQFKKNEAKKRKIAFVRTGHQAKKHKGTSLKDLAIIS